MPQLNGKVINGKYAAHILECAAIAKQVGEALGLRDDAARQACFATVCIDAKNHGVFLELVPKDSKTPVIQPEAAAAFNATDNKGESSRKRDEAAAAKADGQIQGVPKTATAEMDEGARRASFLAGIESARQLLNKLGHKPEVTPKGLCTFITKQFPGKTNLGSLDVEELEKLTMLMSEKVDAQRAKAKPETKTTDLEDWP